MRGATLHELHFVVFIEISIHAPLCGERRRYRRDNTVRVYFNPRSPMRGATMNKIDTIKESKKFQSTLPYAGSDG